MSFLTTGKRWHVAILAQNISNYGQYVVNDSYITRLRIRAVEELRSMNVLPDVN